MLNVSFAHLRGISESIILVAILVAFSVLKQPVRL